MNDDSLFRHDLKIMEENNKKFFGTKKDICVRVRLVRDGGSTIRTVKLDASWESANHEDLFNEVFRIGNWPDAKVHTPINVSSSVQTGDIIEFKEGRFLICAKMILTEINYGCLGCKPCGFRRLTDDEYKSYRAGWKKLYDARLGLDWGGRSNKIERALFALASSPNDVN